MSGGVALFGGSFDPIHFGHLLSARCATERLAAGGAVIHRIVLIPSAVPPHKRGAALTDGAHRLEMARLAVAGDDLFEVSDVEFRRSGPSYTIDTIDEIRRTGAGPTGTGRGEAALYWLIGADTLAELHSWHRAAELVTRAQFVTMVRPGFTPPDRASLAAWAGDAAADGLLRHCVATPAVEISSTEIRERVRAGQSIRYMVPEAVRSHIGATRLYE